MTDHSKMTGNFRIEGSWWIPDKPDRKLPGIFEFTPKQAILKLWGSFKDITEINQHRPPEIILGNSIDGEDLTLNGIYESGSTLGSGGFRTRYGAIRVFRGIHFDKESDIVFKDISVQYSNFDNWLDISGFQIEPNLDGSMEIKHTSPSLIHATINNDYKITIGFNVQHFVSHVDHKEVRITQTGIAVIERNNAVSFTEFLKIQHHLRNFLSLAMMSPCYPLLITGNVESNNAPNGYTDVGIYYSSKTPETIAGIHDMHMLFRYRDISTNFEQYVKNWFDKSEILEPVFNLYFGTLYNQDMYLDHTFLSLIQAIETYHRRTMTNFVWSEQDFIAIQKEVTDNASEKYKAWVSQKFQYGNEPTLRKRIKEILDEFKSLFDEFSIYDSKFTSDIVDTRNYFTHYDVSLKDKALKDQDLFKATQKLRALLEVCFMKQLGMSNNDMKKIVKRSLQNKLLIPIP